MADKLTILIPRRVFEFVDLLRISNKLGFIAMRKFFHINIGVSGNISVVCQPLVRCIIGDPKCEETTVAGAIIKNYFHKNVGESAFDPGFALIAIMEWAGIIKSEWGYVELTPQYRQEIGYYD